MSEMTPFEFTSKQCKRNSHLDCAGYWRGIGIEAICICECGHNKNQKVLESGVGVFYSSTCTSEAVRH